jgi:hypothetical protein
MTENATADPVPNPFFEPWMECWSKALDQSKDQMTVVLEAMHGVPDSEAFRRRWLDSLSQNFDTFLR